MEPIIKNLLNNEQNTSQIVKAIMAGCSILCLLISLLLFVDYRRRSKEIHLVEAAELPDPAPVEVGVVEEVNTVVIYVDISGAVLDPGIYMLDEGSRVNDLIILSGGITDDADTAWVQRTLNLAAVLVDGQKVYVPFEGESSEVATDLLGIDMDSKEKGSVVNINTASESELETLPGIGPTMARAIVQYREERGLFDRKEALMDVPGIGQKTFDALKELIKV